MFSNYYDQDGGADYYYDYDYDGGDYYDYAYKYDVVDDDDDADDVSCAYACQDEYDGYVYDLLF